MLEIRPKTADLTIVLLPNATDAVHILVNATEHCGRQVVVDDMLDTSAVSHYNQLSSRSRLRSG
jgi:hypothetical protein